MPGVFPLDFVSHPERFSVEEAYSLMDGFTFEELRPEELTYSIVLIPPLRIGGTRLRGLLFSPGIDVITRLFPPLEELFVTIANSRWCGYPWSDHAAGAFTCYANAHREEHYRQRNPGRQARALIPAQTADYTSELQFRPLEGQVKDIDVLVVARPVPMKNLLLLAQAAKVLRERTPERRYRIVWALATTPEQMRQSTTARGVLREMESILGRLEDYIDPLGNVERTQMPDLYRRTRVLFLPSKVEGKNRAIAEALCSDVPVVALREYNEAARALNEILPLGAGLLVDSTPEAVAAGLARAVSQYGDFRARESYLREGGGRMGFFWKCLMSFDSFREMLPHTTSQDNERWLDGVLRANCGVGLREFLFYSTAHSHMARKWGVGDLGRAEGVAPTLQLLHCYASL
jgi:glycosyltransferase involved in cell wall biosynthesis